MIRLGLPEDLLKAGAGFSRGLGGGYHKYWKRVRRMVGGKLKWIYYYDDPKERRKWIEHAAKDITDKKAAIAALEAEHRAGSSFGADHPVLKQARKELAELTTEFVAESLGWHDAPKLTMSDKAKDVYHQAVVDLYQDGEPENLMGQQMSLLRAVNMAFDVLPPFIRETFDGSIASIKICEKKEDAYAAKTPCSGYCRGTGKGGSEIVLVADELTAGVGRGAVMQGGLWPVEVAVHEMMHAVHNQIGAHGVGRLKGANGATWADWLDFEKDKWGGETGVTPYATNGVKGRPDTIKYERWAESMTAAIMYPHQLASSCPKMYEWCRGFLGETAMRPLRTDPVAMAKLSAEHQAALDKGDRAAASRLADEMDAATGVLDMSSRDPRLQWWKAKETRIQKVLRASRQSEALSYSTAYRSPEDKFYEMNVGPRTIYMRVGPSKPDDKYSGWDPADKGTAKIKPKASEIKEIYDERGEPLDPRQAWWYLHQDELPDEHPDVVALSSLEATDATDKAAYNLRRKMMLNEQLVQITTAALRGEKLEKVPVAMDEAEFRLRSGTFAYDRFDMAGHQELAQLRVEADPAKRDQLLADFMRKNPGVEKEYARDPKTGRQLKARPVMAVSKQGEQPVPVMRTIRYLNDNPDGTKTAIECSRDDSQAGAGRFYIQSPVWRELLTPRGEDIKSAEHLAELCRQAGQDRRKAWVSVQTDSAGDTAHYYHIQVEFDGHGQPRILGDEWRKRLGKDIPRIDDLLKVGKAEGRSVTPQRVSRVDPKEYLGGVATAISGVSGLDPDLTAALSVTGTMVEIRSKKMLPDDYDRLMNRLKDAGYEPAYGVGPPHPKKGKAAAEAAAYIDIAVPRDAVVSEEVVHAEGTEIGRPVVKAENIKLEKMKAKKRTIPDLNGRVILAASGAELGQKDGKDVIVRLTGILKGKKAGEVPPEPGWDRMPEGQPGLQYKLAPLAATSRLSKREQALMKRGVLPPWYNPVAVPEQGAWYQNVLAPALADWEATKAEKTAESWDDQYVFTGESGGGAGGKRIILHSAKDLLKRTREPVRNRMPKALLKDTLVYAHQRVDPINGRIVTQEIRLLLPRNGSVDAGLFGPERTLDGVTYGKDEDGAYIAVSMDGFAKLREQLGGVSLTEEAEQILHAKAEMLREAAARAREKKHVIEIGDITSGNLHKGIPGLTGPVGINELLPNKMPFVIAEHQKKLIQFALDNRGRVLGAHSPGTGKTPTSIVAAKTLMAMVDPNDPTKPHPMAPKKVLIVAPLNTVEQWVQAAAAFDDGAHLIGTGGNSIPVKQFVAGVKSGQYGYDLAVVGPEYWTIHEAELKEAGFDGLIVDEAHQGLRDEKSRRNGAMSKWNKDMKMLMLLSGTPITTSPADILEYVKILSKGEQWAGMTRAQFIEEYLEESPVPGEIGIVGKKGPMTQIKASKLAELSAIIAQWTDVCSPKDVVGKVIPAIRTEENKHAEMTGVQAVLYSMHMAALSPKERDDLINRPGGVSDDELAGLSEEAKKSVLAAKAIANCLAYKPQSAERSVGVFKYVPQPGGGMAKQKVDFRTFDPDVLFNPELRGKAVGRWPSIDEIGEEHLAYTAWCSDVIGGDYLSVAGTKITPEQRARMEAAGWRTPGGMKIKNPDAGPVGIRCRGIDRPARPDPHLDNALALQRDYANVMTGGVLTTPDFGDDEPEDGKRKKKVKEAKFQVPTPATGLAIVAARANVTVETAERWLSLRPDATDHFNTVTNATWGDGSITVAEGDLWTSDVRGSLHLLYRPADWDYDAGRPKLGKPIDGETRDGAMVEIVGASILKPPKGLTAEEKKAWAAPGTRYDASSSTDTHIAVVRDDTGEIVLVPRADVRTRVASLMDPGMRAERDRADVAMVVGNAKTEEIRARISKFHQDTGPGPNGARQMVLFGNGILDACRPMEATLRQMGMMDVNEAIEGSVEYDPADPRAKTGAPTGKYFVTYIGGTYTGNRDLNVDIFKKRKDALDRDLEESVFVYKANEGTRWRAYPSDVPYDGISASQWTTDQRLAVLKQFKIKLPESYVKADTGDTVTQKFFYGTPRSAAILRELDLAGDPSKMPSALGETTRVRIAQLKDEYAAIARKGATNQPPLTERQKAVFNNTDFIVCSDAAQVGMNLGNSAEMIMYDDLGSPMAEWQRMTRCARLLPAAVPEQLAATFAKIKAQETELFRPGQRGGGAGGGGMIPGVSLDTGNGPEELGDLTFAGALTTIRSHALRMAANSGKDLAPAWQAIANKAALASSLGTTQTLSFFEGLRSTRVPGGTGTVLDAGSPVYADPMKGTYGEVEVDGPGQAITRAIADLSDAERLAIGKAGFVRPGGDPNDPRGGGLDGGAIYMAMRAEEILNYVEGRRPEVTARLRGAPGGAAVTDFDVANAIIDELNPNDRAILKTRKYLVNVDRLGVAAYVPQTITIKGKKAVIDKETGQEMSAETPDVTVFTGYTKEQPIAPTVQTRATGRARLTANEALMQAIQTKVAPRTELDYFVSTPTDIANASRKDLEKGDARPGFPLSFFSREALRG